MQIYFRYSVIHGSESNYRDRHIFRFSICWSLFEIEFIWFLCACFSYTRKRCLQVVGLTIRRFTLYRFPIQKLLIDSSNFTDSKNLPLHPCGDQARNQLEILGGAKIFLRWAQMFWTMSNSFTPFPIHFFRGAKSFQAGLRPPLVTGLVETSYLNTDMCKLESSQSHESRAQSTDSSNAHSQLRAFLMVLYFYGSQISL